MAANTQNGPAVPAPTATPIKYLIVIFQRNVSFDHYLGTYPNAVSAPGEPRGHAIAPALPHEAGRKDTAQTWPGMVTRIIVKFDGYAGRYVWHCHLLEHSGNEMMRPFEVLSA